MTVPFLIALYAAVGAALALHVYKKSTASRPRALAAASAMFILWPLWAPFVLMDDT